MKRISRKYIVVHDKAECMTLIDMVEQHPVLWKHDVKLYSDRKRKCDAWRDIAENLGQSEETVEANWRSILKFYTREKTKQKNTRGSATSDAYVSRWFAFQRLAFLENSSKSRSNVESSKLPAGTSGYQNRQINKPPAPATSSTHPPDHGVIGITKTPAPTSSISQSRFAQNVFSPLPSTSNPVSQKPERKRSATDNDEQLQTINETDRYQTFGLMVTNTLRECCPAQSESIMHGISDVICKVKSGIA